MTFGLREGVSFCVAGGRHFFLDRNANRYFALRASDEALFARLIDRTIDLAQAQGASRALAQLVCARAQKPLTPFAMTQAPCCDANWQHVRAQPLLVMRAMLAFAWIKLRLARHPPAELFKAFALQKQTRPARQVSQAGLDALGRAFEQVRAWTGENQCLPLSLSFAHLAYGMGYPVIIVFAITPRPFGAHCWVQLGGKVLNDHLGRVEAFTPIYAI